jgi:hypothetical protein
MDAFDLFGDIDITDIILIIILGAVQEAVSKVSRSTRPPGADYLDELLDCENEKRIYSALQIKEETFVSCVYDWKRTAVYGLQFMSVSINK